MSAPRPIKRRTQTNLATSQLPGVQKEGKPSRGRTAGSNVLTSQLLGLNGKARGKGGPSLVNNQSSAFSLDGKTQLIIISQPEQQHRARYQTEGSRGAVKDRSGNSFPQVQLSGWPGAATLEVFIGSDCGKVVPHMFYQACRVSGKNSTQCQERTEEGTVFIEVPFEPGKDMVVTCDCVGILKERNVDVEHRFPDQSGSRNKKKSTRCRMVFRTTLTHPDGSQETLQIFSQPIACTQPPGVPEICKKSLTASPACGGPELFIFGKNFLKDTRVLFSNPDLQPPWEASVIPDKEYLQQSHLVCVVPPYHSPHICEPVTVRLTVVSSDKSSEAHCFTYTPQPSVDTAEEGIQSTKVVQPGANPPASESGGVAHPSEVITPDRVCSTLLTALNNLPPKSSAANSVEPVLPPLSSQYLLVEPKQGSNRESIFPMVMWKSAGSEGTKLMSVSCKAKKLLSLPAAQKKSQLTESPTFVTLPRRLSTTKIIKTDDGDSKPSAEPGLLPTELKGIDLRIKPTAPDSARQATPSLKVSMATGADLSSTLPPSMATLRRFVANDNGSPLPSLSVENFLSRLERKPENEKNGQKASFLSQPDGKHLNKNTFSPQEYVPLDSVVSVNMPLGIRAQTLSNLRRISEETAASASMDRKPSKTNPLSALHHSSPFSLHPSRTSSHQNENLAAVSATNQLLGASPEQESTFPVRSPALTVDQRDTLESRFVSQDLAISSTRTPALDTSKSPQRTRNDSTIESPNNTYSAGNIESSPVGNCDVLQHSAGLAVLPPYEKHTLPVASNDITLPFNGYVMENGEDGIMHSPPGKSTNSIIADQAPSFDNLRIVHVDLKLTSNKCNNMPLNTQHPRSTSNFVADSGTSSAICSISSSNFTGEAGTTASVRPMSTSNFTAEAGTPVSMCPLPVASKNAAMSSEVLPEPHNNHSVLNFHCSPPLISENSRLIKAQISSPINIGYVSESSNSPPIAIKNILVHSQVPSLFGNYMPENVSSTSVSHPQMTKGNNVVIENHHLSPLNGFTTECQTVGNANVTAMRVSSSNILLDSNMSKSHNEFDVKNQAVTSASPPQVGSKNITICSQDLPPLYSFVTEDCVTHSTCSPPINCISSHDLSSPTTKVGLVNSLCVPAGNNYNITHVAQNIVDSAATCKPYTTHVAVDTRVLEDLHGSMATNSLGSLPSSAGNILVGSNQLLTTTTTLDNVPQDPASSALLGDERRVDNVPTSLGMSNLLLRQAVALNGGGNVSNHCTPSIAMKNIILNCDMPNNHMHLDSSASLSAMGPVVHAYNKACPEQVSQIAMKNMMLSVDVSSTMEGQMITQPGAVTPETVRLDALVNSTLDNHIHATQATATSNQQSKPYSSPTHSPTSATPLLNAMFSLNDRSKDTDIGHLQPTVMHSDTLQLSPAPRHGSCDMARGLLCQVTNASKCAQLNGSTEIVNHSMNGEFKSEPITTTGTNVGFTTMPTSPHFSVSPDLTSIQFTCVSTNSRDIICDISKRSLGQLMDLEEHRVKMEEGRTQKVGLKDGLAVRERREEGMLPHELTQMSDHDLISYINPSCFDQV